MILILNSNRGVFFLKISKPKPAQTTPPMCTTSFIAIDGASSSLCDYLFAKFVIFCVFGGWAALYMLVIPRINPEFLGQVCCTAIVFELLALLLALCYLGMAVMFATELLCSFLLCFCCCLIIPLLERARARGISPRESDCISSSTVIIACNECYDLTFMSRRVDPALPADPGTVTVVVGDQRIKHDLVLLAKATRCAISMV